MPLSVGLIWVGALLVAAGVLVTAGKALFRGRLSEAVGRDRSAANPTLEPREPSGGLSLKANWSGLALVALGAVLLLAGASV